MLSNWKAPFKQTKNELQNKHLMMGMIIFMASFPTGVDWHFMFTSGGIYCTSKSEYQIDLTKKAIISIVVGLLKDRVMVCDEPGSKKRRVQEKIQK